MAVILETQRLLFRPHEIGDLEAYCAMEADPEVRRYVGGQPRPRDQAEARFRKGLPMADPPDRLALWATVYKPEGCYIGRCGVYPHFDAEGKPLPGEGVLAFYLARPYWGRGLATEAGQAFLEFGFTQLNLDRIVAQVDADNHASMRVLEKLRFHLTGTEQGEKRSFHFYEMTSAQWEHRE
ncbi:MAG TPA: GNAT family N-acetyltransferase [Chthonomonadaceae bacterium]|nr:GNAT family N-acetyltransferase [Chthonomonadaceae bacterium]